MQGKKLYIGNLTYNTTVEEITELLSKYGTVSDVRVIGDKGFGFDFDSIRGFAHQVKAITALGAQVALVIGGGHCWRSYSDVWNDGRAY